jgi:RNA polymerase sigma-70 factor (ECF subfamily)
MEAISTDSISKTSDGELVAAAKCGNTQAFEQLVIRYERRVLAIAQRILNNREDAEDVMQESFHKAFVHLSAFREKSRFSTWLTRIAVNESFMVLRRRRRTPEVSQECPEEDATPVTEIFVDRDLNPEQACLEQERAKFISNAITRLTPNLRRTILLYNFEERSVKETAELLGTTIAAVKSRLNHGRQKLRAQLVPVYQFEISAAGPNATRCV